MSLVGGWLACSPKVKGGLSKGVTVSRSPGKDRGDGAHSRELFLQPAARMNIIDFLIEGCRSLHIK